MENEIDKDKACPECGAPPNERRDGELGASWRQCENKECLQEYFTDIDYDTSMKKLT